MGGGGGSQPGVCIPPPSPAEQEWDKGRRNREEGGSKEGPDQAAAEKSKGRAHRQTPRT